MRFIRNIALTFFLFLASWWLLGKMNLLPSLGDIFSPKKVEIDRTPVVIQQIKSLAQLVTVTAYTEVTADSTMRSTLGERLRDVFNPFSVQVNMNRQLVIVGNVVVHAGVNLDKLNPQQVFIRGDSISLQLPPAEILDVILNPSGTDIFVEEGTWNNEAVTAVKARIRDKAVSELKDRGVLYQADERAREVLLQFFRAAGFKQVTITKSRLG
jgi:hypothetical protein